MISPYFQEDGITIYNADNRDILPHLPKFDLLLTDPPYGIGADKNQRANTQYGKSKAVCRDYGVGNWDNESADDETLDLCRSLCTYSIIWGGNFFSVPPSSCWLVWDKMNGDNGYADAELAWTNLEGAVRIKQHRWHGMLRKHSEDRFHPTQKPLDVIVWAMNHSPDSIQTVLDPFMGSGTTLVAAKLRGLHATGIELSKAYCDIAIERLSQKILIPV